MDIGPTLGLGRTFEFRGKTYEAKELTPLHIGQFSEWLKMRARADCARTQETCPPEMQAWARVQTSVVQADIAAGVYGVGGEAYIKATMTMEGVAQILLLSAAEAHPELTYEDCLEMVKDRFNAMARQVGLEQAAEVRDAGKS